MRKLIFPLSVFLVNSLFAQHFSFKSLNSIDNKKTPVGIIPVGNGYFGTETSGKAKFGWTVNLEKMRASCKLLAFDKNMTFIKENALSDGKEVYGPFTSFLKRINNTPYLIYYNYNNENKSIELFTSRIDSNNLTITDSKKVLSIDQKNVGLFKIMNLYGSYRLVIESSPDNQKTLFLWAPGTQNTFSWSIVDNNMKTIYTKNDVIEEATDIIINNAIIDNDANFFLGYTYKKKDNYHAGLLMGDKKGKTKNIEISFDKGSANYCYITKGNTENDLRICGVYSEDQYYLTGSFSSLVDKKSLHLSNFIFKPFTDNLVEKFDEDGYAKSKKNKFGLFPEVIFDLVTLSDGTVVMAGDLTRYQATGSGVNVMQSPVVGSTLLVVVKDDSIRNMRIPKKEIFGYHGNNLFLHKYGSKAILFYADLESNLDRPLEESKCTNFTNRKDNVMVAAVIESKGTITRRILNPVIDGRVSFYPGTMDSLGDSSILLHLDKDKIRLTNIKTDYAFYLLTIEN